MGISPQHITYMKTEYVKYMSKAMYLKGIGMQRRAEVLLAAEMFLLEVNAAMAPLGVVVLVFSP